MAVAAAAAALDRYAVCAMIKYDNDYDNVHVNDGQDSDRFQSDILLSYQVRDTNGLELMEAGSQVTSSVLCYRWRWRWCADS